MVAWFRAGLAAALLIFVSIPASAADKAFQDDALDEAAITLAADLKNESGFHPDDWEYAHFWDARYVSPISIMARFSFLSDKELQDLTAYVQTRAGTINDAMSKAAGRVSTLASCAICGGDAVWRGLVGRGERSPLYH